MILMLPSIFWMVSIIIVSLYIQSQNGRYHFLSWETLRQKSPASNLPKVVIYLAMNMADYHNISQLLPLTILDGFQYVAQPRKVCAFKKCNDYHEFLHIRNNRGCKHSTGNNLTALIYSLVNSLQGQTQQYGRYSFGHTSFEQQSLNKPGKNGNIKSVTH